MNVVKSKLRSLWGTYLYYKYKRLYEKNPAEAADSMYYKIYGRHMVLDHPKNLIEKITWMSLNTDVSLWTLCADKYRMRSYVENKGLGEYLPKLYGHWDNPDDIDFTKLPNSFVLKANNGCATVKIVRDKAKENEKELKDMMKKWLKRPFGYMGAQKHYLSIPPCVIAEELLVQDDEEKKFSNSMVDYKMWCFSGKPESTIIVYNRQVGHLNVALYDNNWNLLADKVQTKGEDVFDKNIKVSRPICFDKMKEIASILSEDFPEVRVDFYVIAGKPVIGELTFTTGYGYFTDDYYEYLGTKIKLPTDDE